MPKALLIDRTTLLNPPQLAAALISYRTVYPELWILAEDYRDLAYECFEVLENVIQASKAPGLPELFDLGLDASAGRAFDTRTHEDIDWDETYFRARGRNGVRKTKSTDLQLNHRLIESGVFNPLASRAMVEESKKRGILKVASYSKCREFSNRGWESTRSRSRISSLLGDEKGYLKDVRKSRAFPELAMIEQESSDDSVRARGNRVMEKLWTRTHYVGAALTEGWTLHTIDPYMSRWMVQNIPVELNPSRPTMVRAKQAVVFKPTEFSTGEVFEIMDDTGTISKLADIQNAINEAEKRKRVKTDVLLLFLGITVGGAAAVSTNIMGLPTSAGQFAGMSSEAVLGLAVYLFRHH